MLFFVPIREIVDSIFERMLVEVGKAELEESILTFGFFLVLDEGVCCTRLFCCDGECIVPSLEYGVRIGAPLTERLIVAGEFDGFSNIFSKDSKYEVFNSFMAGPSVIFYPAKHFQVSGSLGFAWTDNRTNTSAVDSENGKGVGYSLSAAFDTGTNNGALIGAKIYGTSVVSENSDDVSTNVGASLFVRFVHK